MFLGSLFASRNRTGSKGDFRGRIFREKEGRGVACIWGVLFFRGGGVLAGGKEGPILARIWKFNGVAQQYRNTTVWQVVFKKNFFLRKGIVWDIFRRGSETAKLIYSSSACCCHKDSNNIVFVILVPLLLPLFPTNVQQRRLFFRSNRLLRHSLTGFTSPPKKKNFTQELTLPSLFVPPPKKKEEGLPNSREKEALIAVLVPSRPSDRRQ